MTDLLIRRGRILTGDSLIESDLAIENGVITEIAPTLSGSARVEIDAAGRLVLPGILDAHVHFNEPGRTHWEGFASGSRALAAGGGTSFVDMPLNATPPTIDRPAFDLKRAAGEASSILDFGLWGGLVPGNADQLEDLAACGVTGFKAFMIDSGIADFPGVDTAVLREGMKIAGRLGLPVAVHAEDATLIDARTAAFSTNPHTTPADGVRRFLDSRPPESEIEAVRIALDLAGETGCALQIVHVSCPESISLIAAARAAGVDVTAEACPHHLLLNEDAMFAHGAFAKCAPPLRDEGRRAALWDDLLAGRIDVVGSDHSPAPPEMKQGDVFRAWGGIMGCQHGFLLLLDRILETRPDALPALWAHISSRPAERLGLGHRKGRIAPGFDADLIIIEQAAPRPITTGELLYRHPTSPYVGLVIRSRVARSFLRGQDVGLSGSRGCFLSRNL